MVLGVSAVLEHLPRRRQVRVVKEITQHRRRRGPRAIRPRWLSIVAPNAVQHAVRQQFDSILDNQDENKSLLCGSRGL